MKKTRLRLLRNLFYLLFTVSLAGLLPGQEKIYEHVEVVNQEILVRVFSGGTPVSGLKLEDFELYENGKKLDINYCRELKRSMAGAEVPATAGPAVSGRQRLFLFMLWFNEESRDWPKAWDYFLNRIYRPGDRVVLSDGERALEFASPEREREKWTAFFKEMNEGCKQKKTRKDQLVNELERSADNLRNDLLMSSQTRKDIQAESEFLDEFKRTYKGALDEYLLPLRRNYAGWLRGLADSLKAVDAEKWVLIFLQNERLPLVSREGRLFRETPMLGETFNKLKQFMADAERQIMLGTDLVTYLNDLKPLFSGANATYHLFLGDAAHESLSTSESMEWRPVYSSWEECFRLISSDTGGRVNDTTRLAEALGTVAALEDVYYVLTYQPEEGIGAKRKMKIAVNRPGVKVAYSRKLTLGELFPMRIRALEWRDGKLKISLADFQRQYGESGLSGRLRVGVRGQGKGKRNQAGEIEITPSEAAVTVEFALHFSAPGRWKLAVEVKDMLSGNRTSAEKVVEIPAKPEPPMQLGVDAFTDS